MNHKHVLSVVAILFAALIIIFISSRPEMESVSASPTYVRYIAMQTAAVDETFANCRYGAAPAGNSGKETAIISELGAGWYLTFGEKEPNPSPDNGSDFVHMIHVRQKKLGFDYLPGYEIKPVLDNFLAAYIQNNPGDIWIFGNEVDRGPSPGETDPNARAQGDTHPEVYAEAYHEAYHFIKNVDPTAQIAISGLVQVTPGRLQYLNKVWNAYLQKFGQRMPVDVWTMHLYILPEVQPDGVTPNGIANVALGTDPTLGQRESGGDPDACSDPGVYCFAEHDDMNAFAGQVMAMRQWMADHGEKEKPLLLTEYSILYPNISDGDTCFIQDEFGQCFTPERVENFMSKSFAYLNEEAKDPNLGYSLDNNRLIQQYMWFSVYNKGVGEVSNLIEEDLVTLTALGQNFRNHVANEAPSRNLLVEQVANLAAIVPEGEAKTATLSVTFRNNGNTKIDQPFTVTFYEDANLTRPIASTAITSTVFGCASRPYVATVEWPGLDEGFHNFWVKIDSGNAINEQPGKGDNVGSGWVRIVKNGAYLPSIRSYN